MSFKAARVGAGSGEVPGRTLSLRLPARLAERGSFMACVLAGCRGEAWLKKGLLSSKQRCPSSLFDAGSSEEAGRWTV
jgi:hypothetical protein